MDWLYIGACVGVAVAALLAISWNVRGTQATSPYRLRTTGVVVRQKVSWGRGGIIVQPVVRFTTADNRVIEAVDNSCLVTFFARYSVGQKLVVLYDVRNLTQFSTSEA